MIMTISRVILSYLFFMQSMLFQVSLPDFVLCFGDNGHVAVEAADNKEHCVNEFSSPEAVNFTKIVALPNIPLNVCSDVSLDTQWQHVIIKQSEKHQIPDLKTGLFIKSALMSSSSHTTPPLEYNSILPQYSAVCNVVLLI